MSIYRYTVSNYHAVKDADITIDGITVLAGENGCGKSTLSRWLYYLVNGAQQFETLTIKEYVDEINDAIQRQYRAVREIRYYLKSKVQSQRDFSLTRISSKLLNNKEVYEDNIQQIQDIFENNTRSIGHWIEELAGSTIPNKIRKRIMSYLDMDSYANVDNPSLVADYYLDAKIKWLRNRTDKLYVDLEDRSMKFFIDNVRQEYQENDDIPRHIQFYEDNVELFNKKRVSSLFNLRHAIYIDTPMALTNESAENIFWNELRNLIMCPKQKLDMTGQKLLRRITKILHGEAKLVKYDSTFTDDELRFISDDGKVNIEIEKVATGFKTFIYLQRLLENGFLGNDSILLIDEPEAHLHPQWIVEYARILVLLNKELGLKIMLATHNPDMVAAIRSIAEKEEVLDKTNFYISESSGQSNTYCYKALGTDISEIFSSFNIALDRIQAYGSDNL